MIYYFTYCKMEIKWFFLQWLFELIKFSKKLFEPRIRYQTAICSNAGISHKVRVDDNRSTYDRDCRRPNNKYYLDKNWYKRFSDSGILVSRRAATKKLGRKLRPGEVVHHINKNKVDNSPDNLYVFSSRSAHNRFHKAHDYKYSK